MASSRRHFLQYLAQTSESPYLIDADRAQGIYIYGPGGERYVDLVSGVSVSNLGHGHPAVKDAVKEQVERYMHLHVYGELIQEPQVNLARKLAEILPSSLNCTYFVNSGSEAIEGALKLARRYTGRYRMIAFRNAYHGGTAGALSVMGDEDLRNAYRPLPPGVTLLDFNDFEGLDGIDDSIACVLIEPIQGEAGIILPENGFLEDLYKRCKQTGALLVFDEVQVAFGRTGKMFAFEHTGVVPDILVLAKALGGGLPLGAFIAASEIMKVLSQDPALGHITTFGGHPVSCAAGLASLEVLLESDLIAGSEEKGRRFRDLISHPLVREIRGMGLYYAVELGDRLKIRDFLRVSVEQGIISDSFLFHETAFRISPPLTITGIEIEEVKTSLRRVLDLLAKE
jgi:acetylornithine/succinyldiaminopimelate/putrescine aminotransferase